MAARTVLIAFLTTVLQAAQLRPATLQGHVVRAGSSAPVSHACVVVAKVGGTLADYRTITTGADGRFRQADIPAGTYRVFATHEGYVQGEFGRRPAGTSGVPISLVEGQSSTDLEVAMTPTGVIAGRVLLNAEPVRNAIVRALKSSYFDGTRSFTVADWAQTDDRGEYRLFGLAPGRYFVSAAPAARPRIEGDSVVTPTIPSNANGNSRSDRTPLTLLTLAASAFERTIYPPIYHPGTSDAEVAAPIDLRAGVAVTGIDLTLTPTQPVHLRGQVIVADTSVTISSVSVALQPGDLSYALPVAGARTDATGSFDIGGVVPGRYYLSVQAMGERGGAPQISDVFPVEVGAREPPPVSITLRPGVTIRGRVTVDGGDVEAERPPISVQLRGVQARGSCCGAAMVARDGTFRIDNVPPHEYRVIVRQPGTRFWVKSARFGGDDVLAAPLRMTGDVEGRELEIALDTHTSTLDALVVDADQRPQSGLLVVVVPSSERRGDSSAYYSGTTGADGRARISGIAPGQYTMFATDSIPAAAWQDPDIVRGVEARGTPAEFHDSEMKTIVLRILQ